MGSYQYAWRDTAKEAGGHYTVSEYSAENGKLNSVHADCIYKDERGAFGPERAEVV